MDIKKRAVSHWLTLAMALISGTFLIASNMTAFDSLHLLSIFITAVIAFLCWYFGIWGGSDAKWLPLCFIWLPYEAIADWCLVFSVFLFIAIAVWKKNLPLLVPMNITSILFLLFYMPDIKLDFLT